jgi:hypothetical protein
MLADDIETLREVVMNDHIIILGSAFVLRVVVVKVIATRSHRGKSR